MQITFSIRRVETVDEAMTGGRRTVHLYLYFAVTAGELTLLIWRDPSLLWWYVGTTERSVNSVAYKNSRRILNFGWRFYILTWLMLLSREVVRVFPMVVSLCLVELWARAEDALRLVQRVCCLYQGWKPSGLLSAGTRGLGVKIWCLLRFVFIHYFVVVEIDVAMSLVKIWQPPTIKRQGRLVASFVWH